MPEVEVRTIREADDAGVGVGVGVGVSEGVDVVVGVGVGIGVEVGVDTDVDVVEWVLVEGTGVLLELDIWLVVEVLGVLEVLEEVGDLEDVGVVVVPPPNTPLKIPPIPPRGFSLGSEVGVSSPPNKLPNPSMKNR